jgi:hypothetical protein
MTRGKEIPMTVNRETHLKAVMSIPLQNFAVLDISERQMKLETSQITSLLSWITPEQWKKRKNRRESSRI